MALAMATAMLCYGGRVEGASAEGGVSSTQVMSDPVEIEAFRAELGRYIAGMKSVADAAGIPSDLAAAQQSLPNLTNGDLSTLRAAFATSSSWRTQVRTLRALLRRRPGLTPQPGTTFLPQITANDCPTAVGAGLTQTDIEIATDAAFAADAVLQAVPNDLLSEAARAIAVGIWAVPQAVLRGFSHVYNIAQACQSDQFNAGVTSQLTTILGNDNANTTAILNDVHVGNAQIINNDNVNATAIVAHDSADTLQIIDNANSNTTNILAALGTSADLSLSRQIEDDLVRGACPAWVYTPEFADAAHTVRLGGQFEKVVATIQATIDNARTLHTVRLSELDRAQDRLTAAVAKEALRPLRAERICDLLLDAYAKATPPAEGHEHGHSDDGR
jgi:hypothetical protein